MSVVAPPGATERAAPSERLEMVSSMSLTLRDRWRLWRNRLYGSARFREFSASFWLLRPMARRNARQVFDIVAGFVYSQVLQAVVQLGLIGFLTPAPRRIEEIAEFTRLHIDETERLVSAAVALRLLERCDDGRYTLGAMGAPLVNNEAVLSMVTHHALVYRDLADPVGLLRGAASPSQTSELRQFWPYAQRADPTSLTAAQVAEYSELMSASQPLVATEVLSAYDFAQHQRVLDVGGGKGTFIRAVKRRHPQLDAAVFDLPGVVALPRDGLDAAARDIDARVKRFGGSFVSDPLPTGYDLITLVRVLHDHSDETVMTVLRRVHAALPQGGRLLVAEPMCDAHGAETVGPAYFGLYLLAMGQGRARSPKVLCTMLEQAGFSAPSMLQTRLPLQVDVIVATRMQGK